VSKDLLHDTVFDFDLLSSGQVRVSRRHLSIRNIRQLLIIARSASFLGRHVTVVVLLRDLTPGRLGRLLIRTMMHRVSLGSRHNLLLRLILGHRNHGPLLSKDRITRELLEVCHQVSLHAILTHVHLHALLPHGVSLAHVVLLMGNSLPLQDVVILRGLHVVILVHTHHADVGLASLFA
jgi:hypothetical protein